MNKISEIFGLYCKAENIKKEVAKALQNQLCPYTGKKCIKTRKSSPDIAIGTCTVNYQGNDIIICPFRLLDRQQIFLDCLHLLTLHEPGNQLYVVPEVSIPGGNVDYVLVSAKNKKVIDFVGIELQTMDTTGTVWPERQRFISSCGITVPNADISNSKPFGMNWKMTAKTILIQMHHKSETFENLGRHFVLIIQKNFLDYMKKEFSFDHVKGVRIGDSVHIHSYGLTHSENHLSLSLDSRVSTDSNGISQCLGLQAESRVDFDSMVALLQSKLKDEYLLQLTH